MTNQLDTYYVDPNQCIKYAQNAVQYSDYQYQRTMETYYSYQCPYNQVLILYPESYYSLYACGCFTDNCSSCPYGFCFTCSEGYKLVNQDCIPICKSNQYLDTQQKKYLDCGTNCKLCDSLICKQCTDSTFQVDPRNPPKFYFVQYQQLLNIILKYLDKCSVCQGNTELSNDMNSCNLPCLVSNCITCAYNSATSCKQCAQLYTLNTNNQQCKKCDHDQIMLPDFSCISINSCIVNNCHSWKSQNPLSCEVCSPNYYLNLDSSQCLRYSVQNCKQCSNRNYQQCQMCLDNYSLSSDKSQCLQCQISNCQNCDPQNNLICQTCQANTYLNSNQTQCISCSIQNCLECQSINYQLCKKCISGFQVSSNSMSCGLISHIPHVKTNDFHLEQTLTISGYSVNNNFDYPLVQDTLVLHNFQITGIDSNKYTLQFNLTSSQQLNLQILPSCNIKNSYLIVTKSNTSFAQKNSINNTSQKVQLSPFVLMSQSNIEASQQLTEYGSVFITSSLFSIIPAIFFGNIYIICNTLDITGFLQYLMFLDIRYPLNIINFYELFKNFNFPFIPNFF
ncbi:hypothetical protein ABPG72_022464 [Tetrahymena utriculariae]